MSQIKPFINHFNIVDDAVALEASGFAKGDPDYWTIYKKYRGKVVALWTMGEETFTVMSDMWETYSTLYALVWDEEARECRQLAVQNTNAYGIFKSNDTPWKVDCGARIREKAENWYLAVRMPVEVAEAVDVQFQQALEILVEKIHKLENPAPAKGQWWMVVKGKKVRKHTTGELFWFANQQYGMSFGLTPNKERGNNGKYSDAVFTSAKNCKYMLQPEELEEVVAIQKMWLAPGAEVQQKNNMIPTTSRVYADNLKRMLENSKMVEEGLEFYRLAV